ncbi:unnamed protein product [Agarophyton chilense]
MSVSTAGLIASAPVAWASSSQYLTVPFGAVLRTYDVSQSPPKCIALHVGHTSPVTSVIPMPGMRVASASKDGTLRMWDLRTAQCMRTIDVGRPLSNIECLSPDKMIGYANQELNIIDSSNRAKGKYRKIVKSHVRILRSEEGRIVSAQNGRVVAIIEGNGMHITSTANNLEPLLTVPSRTLLTSIAISVDGSKLAVGDETGVICIYHNLGRTLSLLKKGRNILRPSALDVSRLHWHPSAVRALAFCHQDRVLLSGGNETVLVSWQMNRTNFGTRNFLPRLKAPIIGISASPDEKFYATTHSDNAVRIIDQRSGSVVQTIRGVACRLLDICTDNPKHLFSSRLHPSSLTHFTASNDHTNPTRLWLTGTGPTVQSFEVYLGEQVDEHSVAPKNVIYKPIEKSKERVYPDQLVVTCIAMHKNMNLIATVDHQDLRTSDSNFYGSKKGVYNLRIWNREAGGGLRLISVINEPHGSGNPVTDMSFHSRLPCISTTSSCGTAKLWSKPDSETGFWRCESEKSYKGLPANAVAFSEDGSLEAVAYGNTITVWTLETNESLEDFGSIASTNKNEADSMDFHCKVDFELFRVLVHPPQRDFVQKLAFICGRVPILLACTKYGLYAWNVITQGIWWSHRFSCDPRTLVVDADSNRFAVSIRIPPLVASSIGFGFDAVRKRTSSGLKPIDMSVRDLLNPGEKSPVPSEMGDTGQNETATEKSSITTDAIKVLDDKRHHSHTQKPEVSNNTCQKKFSISDSAIAVFDAGSPVPISVHRLSPGLNVVALAFVQLGTAKSGSNRSLVSFDTNLEVTVHRDYEATESTVSAVTAEIYNPSVVVENSEQSGFLDRLLGEAWQDELRVSSNAKREMERIVLDVKADNGTNVSLPGKIGDAISEAFQGAVHVQGPVPSRLSQLLGSLLQSHREVCDDDKCEKQTATSGKEGESTGEIDGSNKMRSSQHFQPMRESNETESRSFCRSLIRIEHQQSSETKS